MISVNLGAGQERKLWLKSVVFFFIPIPPNQKIHTPKFKMVVQIRLEEQPTHSQSLPCPPLCGCPSLRSSSSHLALPLAPNVQLWSQFLKEQTQSPQRWVGEQYGFVFHRWSESIKLVSVSQIPTFTACDTGWSVIGSRLYLAFLCLAFFQGFNTRLQTKME